MKKLFAFLIGVGLALGYSVSAAPTTTFQRTILPEITNTYDLGSPSKVWRNIYGTILSTSSQFTSITTTYVNALTSAGLFLRNVGGSNVVLLGAGGGQSAAFADGGSFTGALSVGNASHSGATLEMNLLGASGIQRLIDGHDASGTLFFNVASSSVFILNDYTGIGSTEFGPVYTIDLGNTTTPGVMTVRGDGGYLVYGTDGKPVGQFTGNELILGGHGNRTSTFAANALFLNRTITKPDGVFFVDSNGDVSASGTLQVFQTSTINTSLFAGTLGSTTTLWVSTSTGSDLNQGTQAAPFKTIQKAINTTCNSVIGGAWQINVAAGEYPEKVTFCKYSGGQKDRLFGSSIIVLNGSGVNSTVITGDGNTNETVNITDAGSVWLNNLGVSTTFSGSNVRFLRSNLILTDVQLNGVSTLLTGTDATLTFDQGANATTTWNSTGTASKVALTRVQTNWIAQSDIIINNGANAIFFTIAGGTFSTAVANRNFYLSCPVGGCNRGMLLSANAIISMSRSGTGEVKYQGMTGGDASNANITGAITVVGNSQYFNTSANTTFDNVSRALVIIESSRYVENTGTTWNKINGTPTASIWVDPSSFVGLASTTQVLANFSVVPLYGGRGSLTSTLWGYMQANNTFTATNTFNSLVGINSSTPVAQLGIQSTSTANALVIASSTYNLLTVQPNGNIGINNNNPLQPLDIGVAGVGANTMGIQMNTDASNIGPRFLRFARSGSVRFDFGYDGSVDQFFVSNGSRIFWGADRTGHNAILGDDLSGNGASVSASTTFKVTSASTTVNVFQAIASTTLALNVAGDGTVGINTSTPRASLAVQGNALIVGNVSTTNNVSIGGFLGVGTTTPSNYLVVKGGNAAQGLVAGDCGFSSYTGLSMHAICNTTDYTLLGGAADKSLYINRPTSGDMSFRENNVEQMVLKNTTGYLGIASTTPSALLSVGNGLSIDTSGNMITKGNITNNTGSGVLTITSARMTYFQDPTGSGNYFQFANGAGTTQFVGRLNTTNALLTVTNNTSAQGDSIQINSSTGLVMFNVSHLGNVGINTSTPRATLAVQATSTTDVFWVVSSTPLFVIKPNGNIGLGNYAPSTTLHISPTQPALLYGASTSSVAMYDVRVQNGYAYTVSTTQLIAFDVSNPRVPREAGRYSPNDSMASGFNIWVSGQYAYLYGFTNNLNIVDISNPNTMTAAGSFVGSSVGNSVMAVGGYCYEAVNSNGILKFDCSNPKRTPLNIATYSTSTIKSFDIDGRFLFTAEQGSMAVVDVSSTAMLVVGRVPLTNANSKKDIKCSGGKCYIADNTAGLVIVDVKTPTDPRIEATLDTGTPDSVELTGKYAYIADGTNLLQIDISSSTAPRTVATTTVGSTINGMQIVGSLAYLATNAGLKIYQLPSIESPAATIDSLWSSYLNVSDEAFFGNRVTIQNSLNVGLGGIQTTGNLIVAGIQTSTFYAPVSVAGNMAVNTTTFAAATSLFNIGFGARQTLVFQNNGHLTASSTVPVLSTCGTGSTIDGNDWYGTIVFGSAGAACTMTFSSAWTNAPSCLVQFVTSTSNQNIMRYTITNSAVTFGTTTGSGITGLTGGTAYYDCKGRREF